MLELPNFGNSNICIQTFVFKPLIQNNFILRRVGVAIFAEIIKILTTFIIKIYKDSKTVKINRNYVSKYNLYMYFLI